MRTMIPPRCRCVSLSIRQRGHFRHCLRRHERQNVFLPPPPTARNEDSRHARRNSRESERIIMQFLPSGIVVPRVVTCRQVENCAQRSWLRSVAQLIFHVVIRDCRSIVSAMGGSQPPLSYRRIVFRLSRHSVSWLLLPPLLSVRPCFMAANYKGHAAVWHFIALNVKQKLLDHHRRPKFSVRPFLGSSFSISRGFGPAEVHVGLTPSFIRLLGRRVFIP